jgi:O-antigen ligase
MAAPLTAVRFHSVAVVDALLLGAAVAVGVDLFVGVRRSVRLPPRVVGAVALLAAGGVAGTLFASDAVMSVANLVQFTLSVLGPILLLFVWQPDTDALRRYTWLWLAAATTSAAIALFSGGDASGRVRGLTTHPNELALISMLGAALAFSYAVSEVRRRRWTAVAAGAVLCLAVLRSGSRAGLIALVVATLVVLFGVGARTVAACGRAARKARALVLGGGVALAVAMVSVGPVSLGSHNAVRRFLGDATATASDVGRDRLLAGGLRTFAAHPLTGAGFQDPLAAHDVYVQVGAAGGILSLVGFALLAGTVVRSGLASQPRERAWLSTGYLAGFLGYLAAGLFQNMLWDRYLWLHAAVILWLGASRDRDEAAVTECV